MTEKRPRQCGERLRMLAFEPYDAGSHRRVRELISKHSRHTWTWLTRPGRAWKWRMRLGAVELAEQAAGLMDEHERGGQGGGESGASHPHLRIQRHRVE